MVGEGSSAVEYFFGFGVQRCSAGRSPFGAPLRVLELGSSQLGPALREELLGELSARCEGGGSVVYACAWMCGQHVWIAACAFGQRLQRGASPVL